MNKRKKEVEINILIGDNDSNESESDIEMINFLRQKRKKLYFIKQQLNIKKEKTEKSITIKKENSSVKEELITESEKTISPIISAIRTIKFNFEEINKKKKEENNFENDNLKEKNHGIKKQEKLSKDYFEEPTKTSIMITKFPYFNEIKDMSNNIIKNKILKENSQNKKLVNITYCDETEFEKIKQKLSEDEIEYFPKSEKDLLKYCPIEIPGINYPKIINIECNKKEGIYLTNLFNLSKEKKYQSQFRKFILNISEDVIIYNYIIDNDNSNTIESIDINNINIKSYFIQNPGETLIVEPGSIHFSFIKNESLNNINCKIIYWSNSIFDNYKDLRNAINLNNDTLYFPLVNTLIFMLNDNLLKLNPSSIESVYIFLQKVFSEENKVVNTIKKNKKICKYYNNNILFCDDCDKEIINYYTFINRKKCICPKCFSNYSIEIIFQKFYEKEINLLFQRLKKCYSGNYNLDIEFIKKKQKCFELNCQNDKFELSKSEDFQEEKPKTNVLYIDRFLIPLIDIDNRSREGLYNPLSEKYIDITNDAYTKFNYNEDKSEQLKRYNSTIDNLSKLLENEKDIMKIKEENNNIDNNLKNSKSEEIEKKIKGISIFDMFG